MRYEISVCFCIYSDFLFKIEWFYKKLNVFTHHVPFPLVPFLHPCEKVLINISCILALFLILSFLPVCEQTVSFVKLLPLSLVNTNLLLWEWIFRINKNFPRYIRISKEIPQNNNQLTSHMCITTCSLIVSYIITI